MPHLISFETALFDPRREPENPINPIAGHSALTWLRATLASKVEMTEPGYEDWGWYAMAQFRGCNYLVGASAIGGPEASPPLEWIIQVHKQRSIGEKLLGKNRMTQDDALAALVHGALRADSGFSTGELRIE